MNILFAGTPDPSGEILEYLASNSAYNIKGVITQPDKPQKRGNKILESSVSKISLKYDFPVFKPTNLNDPDFIKDIENIEFDKIRITEVCGFKNRKVILQRYFRYARL